MWNFQIEEDIYYTEEVKIYFNSIFWKASIKQIRFHIWIKDSSPCTVITWEEK